MPDPAVVGSYSLDRLHTSHAGPTFDPVRGTGCSLARVRSILNISPIKTARVSTVPPAAISRMRFTATVYFPFESAWEHSNAAYSESDPIRLSEASTSASLTSLGE